MEIRTERQLNPIADEVAAITAIVRPILHGLLFAIRGEVTAQVTGGREQMSLVMLGATRNRGDGDCGICFEYAVHDAMMRQDPAVMDRVSDALTKCKLSADSMSSILFGAEKEGAQTLIDTASSALTDDSLLMYGTQGRPVKLKRHLSAVAASFRKPTARQPLPQSIQGLWKADLFLGSLSQDKWVGTTVKINPSHLQGARGLRVGVVPAHQGKTDMVRLDEKRSLVVCPLPYDGSFMELFYLAWETVEQFLHAGARVPKEVYLPRPTQRQVAKYLEDRRDFPVLDVIDALEPISQPHLLATASEDASIIDLSYASAKTTTLVLAPEPLTV
jgi:hypothetical protein